MVQYQLKLRISKAQDRLLNDWLFSLTGVWNWALKKIEHEAGLKWLGSREDAQNWLAGHSKKLGIPSHCLQGTIAGVYDSWQRCFKGRAKRPRLKGNRRKLTSIPFPDPIQICPGNRLKLHGAKKLRYHKQTLPKGKIKCGRIIKKASGWYLCLFIDCDRPTIKPKSERQPVGIDPGFKHLLTLSTGEKVDHPRELEAGAKRLAQAQRGRNKKLTARLQERVANQKKERNHKLSLDLVQRFSSIYVSKDNIKGVAHLFGKSVSSSNHYQLRQMLKYKSLAGGTQYIEVDCKFSTQDCSACGSRQGPKGLSGLKVRSWTCTACGADHDRDVNAALNTLNAGAGLALDGSESSVRKLGNETGQKKW